MGAWVDGHLCARCVPASVPRLPTLTNSNVIRNTSPFWGMGSPAGYRWVPFLFYVGTLRWWGPLLGGNGDGETMVRFLPCYQAVESMSKGMALQAAAADAISRFLKFYPGFGNLFSSFLFFFLGGGLPGCVKTGSEVNCRGFREVARTDVGHVTTGRAPPSHVPSHAATMRVKR